MVPKSLALQHAGADRPVDHAADAVDPDAALSVRGRARTASATPCCKLVRHQSPGGTTADQYYTPEELQLIVQESEEQGALRVESGQMLQELFEFGDLTAGEVMVPRVRITGIPVGADPGRAPRDPRRSRRTRATRSTKATSTTSSAWYHIKDLLRLLLSGQPVTARGRPAGCRSCRRPRRSTRCWRRCGASARRWRS